MTPNMRNLLLIWTACGFLAAPTAHAAAAKKPLHAVKTKTKAAANTAASDDGAAEAGDDLDAQPEPGAIANLVTIGLIDGDTDEKLSAVNIRLDRKPAWSKLDEIQDHGSFLQLVIHGAIVPEPGKFYDGGNPYLPKIAVFQLTPTDAGIRLFASKDAAKIKQALTAELLGSRIVVTVDHAKLESLLNPELVGPPAPDKAPTAESVIARTEVRHDIPAPSDLVKQDTQGGKLAGGSIDLRAKLVNVAVFSGIMLALLGLSWILKPYLRKRTALRSGIEPEVAISMKTLASMAVASRQKVSLIQVGDERILIGVTPDAVTFLTAIGRQAATESMSFARALGDKHPAAVDLYPAPRLKNIEGNDEQSLAAPKSAAPKRALAPADVAAKPDLTPKAPAARVPSPNGAPVKAKRPAGSRINVAIDEDGVKDLGLTPTKKAPVEGPEPQKAIDDVTRMIREKLKTLRTI